MAQIALAVLGPLQATLDGVPITGFESQKVRALLVYLALEADRPHGRDALAGLLWPDQPDQDARTNLRQALANLRQALGDLRATPPFLRISGATIQFNRTSDHQIDVATFTDRLDACDQHPHRHPATCTSCARRLQQAVDQYHGDFLAGFFLADSTAFEEWALLKREQLHRRAISALGQLAAYHERRGEYAQAQYDARRQLELDPWREESHRRLMRVLALGGQRSAALMQYATCRRVLAAELGVEPEPETTALYERIQRAEIATPVHLPPMSNLAAYTPLTPLIGRETELAQLADRLEQRDCRLLTLVGPGGIGKTRLALQAAADLSASFRDGVTFIPLAPINAAEFLVPAIAGALGFTFQGPVDPQAQLLAFLRAKDVLLVLDNCEHLLAVAPLVSELLATCPDLVVLATSRAPLHVRGEQQFPVPPLALPDLTQLSDVARLTTYAAVALFVARAQAVQPAFQLTAVTAPTVATICTRLDGLPLAIELAAARSKLFPPAALLARLHAPLAVLTGGAHDLPARQQTIRATIDWSYHLLDAGEQRLFARLAVFVGGCTIAAVEALMLDGDVPRDVLDGLTSLVDKSLLTQIAGSDGEPRFVMLETIREYTLELLEMGGEAEMIRRRHAECFLALAETAEPQFRGPDQRVWLDRIEVEHDNLRAALAWSLEVQRPGTQSPSDDLQSAIGLRLAAALCWFWCRRAYLPEGRRWLEQILAADRGSATPGRVKALVGTSILAGWVNDLEPARVLATEGLALARQQEDTHGIAWSLWALGTATYPNDPVTARPLFAESLALFRAVGDTWGQFGVVSQLGYMARYQGDDSEATTRFHESLALARAIEDTWSVASALNDLGSMMQALGDYAQAAALLEESLARLEELGEKGSISWTRFSLGNNARQQGDNARAITYFTECLAWFREMADSIGIAVSLEGIAQVAIATAQSVPAVRLFGAAAAIRDAIGTPPYPDEQHGYDRLLTAAREQLGVDAFAAAWAAGRALLREQAMAEALVRPKVL